MRLAIIIALAPTAAIALYIYQKDMQDREPAGLLVKLFAFGALSVIPVYIMERLLNHLNFFYGILSVFYTAFIVAAVTEEYFKRLVVIKLAYKSKSYNEKLDGIVYCVFSSLGFATVENLIYVLRGMRGLLFTGISRGIFAVPAHMLFAITMGYYLSLSKFAGDINISRSFRSKSLYMPVILHGIYDFILMIDAQRLIIIFVVFVIYLWKINLDRLDEYVQDSRAKNKIQ